MIALDDILTGEDTRKLNVLPMSFIGNYDVRKFPCMALDDSDEMGKKREDMCQEMCYASVKIDTPIGIAWIGLCQRHWGKMMKEKYGK